MLKAMGTLDPGNLAHKKTPLKLDFEFEMLRFFILGCLADTHFPKTASIALPPGMTDDVLCHKN